ARRDRHAGDRPEEGGRTRLQGRRKRTRHSAAGDEPGGARGGDDAHRHPLPPQHGRNRPAEPGGDGSARRGRTGREPARAAHRRRPRHLRAGALGRRPMTVHFIGAGPGAADLITVRGRDLLARCPVCLYAGSIVPPELVSHCPPGARLVDTAPMSLDEIEAEYVAAHEAGSDVARLHSGDLSVWSAVAEQIRRLERHGIPYTLTPGVPSFAAAAAA